MADSRESVALDDDEKILEQAWQDFQKQKDLKSHEANTISPRDRLISALIDDDETAFSEALSTISKAEIDETFFFGRMDPRRRYKGTLVHVAVLQQRYWAFNLLSKAGANCAALDNNFKTPLSVAVSKNDIEAVKALLPYVSVQSDGSTTPVLHTAVGPEFADVDLVECLRSQRPQVDINVRNASNETPLHFAARNGDVPMVNYLLDQGADLNIFSSNGFTPFHLLAAGATPHTRFADFKPTHLEIAQIFLDRGFDINTQKSDNEDTALCVAARKGNESMVQWLIDHGADIEKVGRYQTPLEAALEADLETVKLLVSKGAVINPDASSERLPVLHRAVMCKSSFEIIEYLLGQGADILAKGREGGTALQWVRDFGLKHTPHTPQNVLTLLENAEREATKKAHKPIDPPERTDTPGDARNKLEAHVAWVEAPLPAHTPHPAPSELPHQPVIAKVCTTAQQPINQATTPASHFSWSGFFGFVVLFLLLSAGFLALGGLTGGLTHVWPDINGLFDAIKLGTDWGMGVLVGSVVLATVVTGGLWLWWNREDPHGETLNFQADEERFSSRESAAVPAHSKPPVPPLKRIVIESNPESKNTSTWPTFRVGNFGGFGS